MAKNRSASLLGWFSVGLGAAQLLAPQRMCDATGIKNRGGTMRAVGARELSAGVGILSQPYPVGWIWGRVAGDVMDIAMLALGLRGEKNDRPRVAASLGAVAGITLLDAFTAARMSRQPANGAHESRADASRILKSVTVNRPPADVYLFWSDVQNYPSFMGKSARDVEISSAGEGRSLSFQCSISKRTVTGQVDVSSGGGGRGAVVTCELHFRGMPSLPGPLGRLSGEMPGDLLASALRRMKQMLEVGEVLTNEGQPSGRGKAQPNEMHRYKRQVAHA